MKIIVTGSLGNIGKPLAKELIEKGHTVTIISSNPEKQQEIEMAGAITAIGSLENGDFLARVFKNADALFAMVPPNYGELDQITYYKRIATNYVNAISGTTIKRVVHLSSYGADLSKGTGFIVGAHHAELILNGLQNVAVTHLRPTYFYYNLLNFIDMIKTAGIIGANYGGEDKLAMVAPSDIASVAANELTTITNANHVQYITSDDRTANEVAGILGAAIGKPGLTWLTFTNEQMQDGMEKRGMPKHIIANLVELGASLHSGALRADYDKHAPVTGKVKLEEFAREFAKAFLA